MPSLLGGFDRAVRSHFTPWLFPKALMAEQLGDFEIMSGDRAVSSTTESVMSLPRGTYSQALQQCHGESGGNRFTATPSRPNGIAQTVLGGLLNNTIDSTQFAFGE